MEWEEKRNSPSIAQMTVTARVGPGRKQELETPSESAMGAAKTQARGIRVSKTT